MALISYKSVASFSVPYFTNVLSFQGIFCQRALTHGRV